MSKKEYYYKISKESKTGKTFLKMMNLGVEIQDIALEYINSIGFEAYRSGYWCYLGGVSCLLDPKPDVDLSKFKRVQDGYMPNLVYTKGKEINKKLKSFGSISIKSVIDLLGLGCLFIKFDVSAINELNIIIKTNVKSTNKDLEAIDASEYHECLIWKTKN